MSAAINFFDDQEAAGRLKIGGLLLKSALVKINGAKIEADWNVQRSTDSNKAIASFRGMKLIDGVMLTLVGTSREDFDDVRALMALMLPKTVNGKPPTLSIENLVLNLIGLTQINFKSWQEGPTDTNGWQVDLEVIQSSPPTPAKTGAQDPAKPGSGASGGVDPQIAALQKERDQLAHEAAGV